MIIALIDNGSLEPAVHLGLRRVAEAISASTSLTVRAVSWKHTDRISPELLDDRPAWTLAPFIRAMAALGQTEFVFIPYFISPQGAIGSALRRDLEQLQTEVGAFHFTFTEGLAERGVIPQLVAERIRETIANTGSQTKPPVVLVDHGGPSATSARVRDAIASAVREILAGEIGPLAAASMEGSHPPFLRNQLEAPGFAGREVIVALLFLSPGRHAGSSGDVARLCAASPARCRLTEVLGHHSTVAETLAAALRDTLSTLHAQPFA